MDINKEREAFEAKYPAAKGLVFADGKYVQRFESQRQRGTCDAINGMWLGFQAGVAWQRTQPAPTTAATGTLREVLAMVLQALDRDAAEGRGIRGEMAAELRATMEAQPAPAVAREAVEVVAYGSSKGYQPVPPRRSLDQNGERISCYDIPLMTVAQHQRIMAAQQR